MEDVRPVLDDRLRPYRTGTIPADAPLLRPTVRRVTDWIMYRPEHLTETGRERFDRLRESRSEHLTLDVRLADVRLDGQREHCTLAAGVRCDRAAVLAAPTTALTSGAVEGDVTLANRPPPPDRRQSPEHVPEPLEVNETACRRAGQRGPAEGGSWEPCRLKARPARFRGPSPADSGLADSRVSRLV